MEDREGGALVVGGDAEGALLIKLDDAGDIVWARRHLPDDGAAAQATAVDTDAAGQIALIGRSAASWVWVLDPTGEPTWSHSIVNSVLGHAVAFADEQLVVACEDSYFARLAVADGALLDEADQTQTSQYPIRGTCDDTLGGYWIVATQDGAPLTCDEGSVAINVVDLDAQRRTWVVGERDGEGFVALIEAG